jgi:hypothetical protein
LSNDGAALSGKVVFLGSNLAYMIIQEIIAIAGKPGLYRVINNGRSNLIVESLGDGKKMGIPATSRVSSLGDITMYTTGEDILLRDVLNRMHAHTGGAEGVSHKAEPGEIRAFIDAIVPELDHERVYNSDLKKLVQWFNALAAYPGAFPLESRQEEVAEEEASTAKDSASPAEGDSAEGAAAATAVAPKAKSTAAKAKPAASAAKAKSAPKSAAKSAAPRKTTSTPRKAG